MSDVKDILGLQPKEITSPKLGDIISPTKKVIQKKKAKKPGNHIPINTLFLISWSKA